MPSIIEFQLSSNPFRCKAKQIKYLFILDKNNFLWHFFFVLFLFAALCADKQDEDWWFFFYLTNYSILGRDKSLIKSLLEKDFNQTTIPRQHVPLRSTIISALKNLISKGWVPQKVLMVALTRHTDQKGFLVRKRRITNIQEYLPYCAASLHLNFKIFYNNLLYCLDSDADTLETIFCSFQALKIA